MTYARVANVGADRPQYTEAAEVVQRRGKDRVRIAAPLGVQRVSRTTAVRTVCMYVVRRPWSTYALVCCTSDICRRSFAHTLDPDDDFCATATCSQRGKQEVVT